MNAIACFCCGDSKPLHGTHDGMMLCRDCWKLPVKEMLAKAQERRKGEKK